MSLFQIFFWTAITVWGLIYVYIVTGNLLAMTSSMMVLLGIAGTGWSSHGGLPLTLILSCLAASRLICGRANAKPFQFWQILSTNGNFDLLKLQLFVFTLMIGAYIVGRVVDTASFPELDVNTLLLLGVSQGIYIGGKLAGTTSLSRAQTIKLELDLKKGELEVKKEEHKALELRQAELNKKKQGMPNQTLEKAEEDELISIPGRISINEEKMKELNTRITDLQSQLDAALRELKLTDK